MPRRDLHHILAELSSFRAEKAWKAFLDSFSTMIMQVVRQFQGQTNHANECFLFVCEKLSDNGFRRLLQFDTRGKARFRTWLKLVDVNLCVDWHRKQRILLIDFSRLMGVLFLLNLLIPSPLLAWQKSIHFDRITIDQGLPDNYVRSITQDHHGFMWFGTANGLAKYDGYRFTIYRHDIDNPDSISSNEILNVFEDREGTLWVGTDAGPNRFNREHPYRCAL